MVSLSEVAQSAPDVPLLSAAAAFCDCNEQENSK